MSDNKGNINVDYDLVDSAFETIEFLSYDCEDLKGKVDKLAQSLDTLGGKHDGCFGGSIQGLDLLSDFISKLGGEYDAIFQFANTALNTFENTENGIMANTDKIADLKWLLVYLGMDRDACDNLNFDEINKYEADTSNYTGADVSSKVNSQIADMLLVKDDDGSYRVLTRKEIEDYIKEQSKADTTSSARSTASYDPGSGVRGSNNTSPSLTADSSVVNSKITPEKVEGILEKRTDENEQKTDELKTDKLNIEETQTLEQNSQIGEKQPEKEQAQEVAQTTQEQPVAEQPASPAVPVAVVGDPQVPVQQPVSVAPSNVSNIGIGNAAPQVGSTTVPEPETPVATPEPEKPEVPNIENTNSSSSSTSSGSTRHNNTIPSVTPSSNTSNNGGSPAKFVFPALGAVAAAGAAGVGAKMYLDKKNSDEEIDDMEDYDDSDLNDDNDYSLEDDYNPNSSIQAPDSSWSLDNNIEENRY